MNATNSNSNVNFHTQHWEKNGTKLKPVVTLMGVYAFHVSFNRLIYSPYSANGMPFKIYYFGGTSKAFMKYVVNSGCVFNVIAGVGDKENTISYISIEPLDTSKTGYYEGAADFQGASPVNSTCEIAQYPSS